MGGGGGMLDLLVMKTDGWVGMGLRSLLGRTSNVEMISPTSEMASIAEVEVDDGRML